MLISIKFNQYKNQFSSVIFANIISLTYGAVLGWMSPYLPVYLSNESPLETGSVTIDEASWIGSYFCSGAVIGTFLYGYISNHYGRKLAVLLLAIPSVLSWLLTIFATNVYHLYIAQILAGLSGGGSYVSIPLYIADIAEPSIRGVLGSIITVSCNLGILVIFTLAIFFGPITSSAIIICLPIIFAFVMLFIPESAQHLLKTDKIEDAEKSLRFYRNCPKEFGNQQKFNDEFTLLKFNSKDTENREDKTSFKELFTPFSTFKKLLMSLTLVIMNPLCGSFPLIVYTSLIFSRSGSDYDPNVSSVAVAVIRLVAAYISTIQIDKCGRRKLLMLSSIGNIFGLTSFAIFSFLFKNGVDLTNFYFVPVVSLSIAIFSTSLGILPVPFVIIAELLPKKVRSKGSTVCIAFSNLISFITLKLFPILLLYIDIYGCMIIFIVFSILALIFIIIVLPETKGKNLEASAENTKL